MKKHEIPIILLAGGFGTRILEETENKPKPMVLISGKPILWHVMNIYAAQGFRKFIIATGYKHEVIDSWVEENTTKNSWGFECEVNTQFTGIETQTGGRLKQIINQTNFDRYMMTYGDGLANVNLERLLSFHLDHRLTATVTSVRPPARFGVIESSNGLVVNFGEKNQADAGWINGGFFVLEKKVENFIEFDSEPFEKQPINKLVEAKSLMSYQHNGFWQPMDTLREKMVLDELARECPPIWLRFQNQD